MGRTIGKAKNVTYTHLAWFLRYNSKKKIHGRHEFIEYPTEEAMLKDVTQNLMRDKSIGDLKYGKIKFV